MTIAGSKKIEFSLPPYAAYSFRNFIIPKYRNLTIYKHLVHVEMKLLKKQGINIRIDAVDSNNKIALNIIKKQPWHIYFGSVNFILTKFFNKVFISKGIYNAGLKIKRIYE